MRTRLPEVCSLAHRGATAARVQHIPFLARARLPSACVSAWTVPAKPRASARPCMRMLAGSVSSGTRAPPLSQQSGFAGWWPRWRCTAATPSLPASCAPRRAMRASCLAVAAARLLRRRSHAWRAEGRVGRCKDVRQQGHQLGHARPVSCCCCARSPQQPRLCRACGACHPFHRCQQCWRGCQWRMYGPPPLHVCKHIRHALA